MSSTAMQLEHSHTVSLSIVRQEPDEKRPTARQPTLQGQQHTEAAEEPSVRPRHANLCFSHRKSRGLAGPSPPCRA